MINDIHSTFDGMNKAYVRAYVCTHVYIVHISAFMHVCAQGDRPEAVRDGEYRTTNTQLTLS